MSSQANPPAPRPIGERLLMATILLGLGDAAGKVLALIITIIRTRSLSAAEYGGFGFIIQTIGMFAQVAGFSLGIAAARYVALFRHNDLEKTRQIAQFITIFGVLLTLIAGGLMISLAPQLSQGALGLIEPMRWSALVLIFQTISGLFLGMLSGTERFRTITLIVFLQNVIMLVGTAWLAPYFGLNGTIWAMAAGFFTALVLSCWHCRELIGRYWASPRQLWTHSRILIDFCIPTLLGGLIIVPASWFATAIIASQHGPIEPLMAGLLILPPSWLACLGLAYEYSSGLRQVALFTAADQFRPMLSLLNNLVAQPMMPIVSSQIHKAEDITLPAEERHQAERASRRAIERSFQLAACLILPAHAFLAFAAPYVMAIFGRTFAANWSIFLAVLAWGAIGGMTGLIGVAMNAHGRVWLVNMLLASYGLCQISVTWIFQSWGEFALATGNLTATVVSFLLSCWILSRIHLLGFRALMIQAMAIGWITFISLLSAWTPSSIRLIAIPFAVGLTFLVLFSFLKSESYYVFRLLADKFGTRFLRKS